ncbi:MAG: hypothetical protein QME77_08890 [bacterium]|nr:hypothetical protein [bacterium]
MIVDPATPIDFKPFIPRLGFLARKDEKWGTVLQTSALELPRADAQLLVEAIGAADATPDLRLAVAEGQAGYGALSLSASSHPMKPDPKSAKG